jgi:hypothetical protein
VLGADPLTWFDENGGVLLGSLEPPPGYVAFVASHLEPLRREAARVVGDEQDADYLYPDVLADVAARWTWLELLRGRLGRDGIAEWYLRHRLARRSRRWLLEEPAPQPASQPADIRVLVEGAPRPVPARSSAAVRLAPQVRPAPRPVADAVVEAALAWWHAYEGRRRQLYIAGLVTVLVFFALAMRQRLS